MELIFLLFWGFGVIITVALPVGLFVFLVWYLSRNSTKKELDKEFRKRARYLGELSSEFSKGKKKSK